MGKKPASRAGKKVKDLPEIRPLWDAKARLLSWNGYVVKEFQQRAHRLVVVLDALQKAGWPQYLKNPFTDEDDQDAREILHDALKGLKMHQTNKLLTFRIVGAGEGLCWELIEKALAMLRKKKEK
jgi:hypothetical protein